MSDIPRSVMEEARRTLAIACSFRTREIGEIVVARALLARDKRAAEIARSAQCKYAGLDPRSIAIRFGWLRAKLAIAKEIERYDTPTGQEDGR